MSRSEGLPNLSHNVGHAPELHAVLADLGAQRNALDKLHHQERLAIGSFPHIEDADNAGMVDPRQGFDLLLKFFLEVGVWIGFVLENFDDHGFRKQLLVARQINHAEAAASDLFLDQVTVLPKSTRRWRGASGGDGSVLCCIAFCHGFSGY